MAPDRGLQGGVHSSRAYQDAPGPDIGDEAIPDPSAFERGRSASFEAFNVQAEAARILAARGNDPTNFTLRGVAVGLVIGVVICFSNIYFGLQTGWISGMSMPTALISFGFFRALSPYLKMQFSPMENVLVQSVAGSVGTMPLGCGFVGVIPALEFLLKPEENGPLNISLGKLCVWAVGVCLFGVVTAVPLRRQVIIREKLKFPSGSATALMIGVLHGEKEDATIVKQDTSAQPVTQDEEENPSRDIRDSVDAPSASQAELLEDLIPNPAAGGSIDWKGKIRLMFIAFIGSSVYTLVSYFIPQLHNIPIFGLPMAQTWLWTLNPSPAYVGQGIIMGPATTLHMLIGAIIGWGILSPIAKHQGWAPGPVDSWETGGKGWIVWVSLAIMLADAVVSLGWLVTQPIVNSLERHGPELRAYVRRGDWQSFANKLNPRSQSRGYTAISNRSDASTPRASDDQPNSHISDPLPPKSATDGPIPEVDAPKSQLISTRTFLIGLVVSFALYFASIHLSFPQIITFPASLLSLVFSLLLSVMGVRALGSTDLNPVSGISKLTQLFFSLLPMSSLAHNPNAIALNLLAGAVSEAAALQAGDLMQDLKTGHLLGASPKAQFYAQLIGSVVGAVVAAAVYRLYTNVYTIPSGQFQTPTAFVWVNTARLLTGQGLPARAAEASAIAAAIYAVLTVVRVAGQARGKAWVSYVPGGIAVAVGMYNTPSFTLARTAGGLISWYWVQWRGKGESGVVVLASGLILGEGLVSIVNLIMESLHVPHL